MGTLTRKRIGQEGPACNRRQIMNSVGCILQTDNNQTALAGQPIRPRQYRTGWVEGNWERWPIEAGLICLGVVEGYQRLIEGDIEMHRAGGGTSPSLGDHLLQVGQLGWGRQG